MKIFAALLCFCFTLLTVNAELFQNNNPFPGQTNPQRYNNIYESEPAVIQKEIQQKKKAWWRVNDSAGNEVTETNSVNEGYKRGNFYILSD